MMQLWGGGIDAGTEKKEGGLRVCHYKHYADDEAEKDKTKVPRKRALVQTTGEFTVST